VAFRSDRLSAALWAAFGVVVVIASWRLDRLENLHINVWSAPGLTPGTVGLLMILLAGALALQGREGKSPGDEDAGDSLGARDGDDAGNVYRTLLSGVMCVLFAGVSLGHGLPFVVEAAVFIFLFITVFSWSHWRAEGRIGRSLLTTLVIALAASGLISWLFESVFLVRLP
jgi:hypothetical protein